jgi:hypothetical protein
VPRVQILWTITLWPRRGRRGRPAKSGTFSTLRSWPGAGLTSPRGVGLGVWVPSHSEPPIGPPGRQHGAHGQPRMRACVPTVVSARLTHAGPSPSAGTDAHWHAHQTMAGHPGCLFPSTIRDRSAFLVGSGIHAPSLAGGARMPPGEGGVPQTTHWDAPVRLTSNWATLRSLVPIPLGRGREARVTP